MSPRTAQEHLFHGRFRLAALHAGDLLASDEGSQAAGLLLRVRLAQGWFADAVQLARERFRVALPATHADGEAALRMHMARVCAGAEPEPALRAMRAVGSFAHDTGDQWLEALAMESIGKTSLLALQVAPSGAPASPLHAFYRWAIALYEEAGDRRAALAAMMSLANAFLGSARDEAVALLEEAMVMAAAAGLQTLELTARLRAAAARPAGADDDLDYILAGRDGLDEPLGRARVLREKTNRSFTRGEYDQATAATVREIFRSEGALLDLIGFCNDIAKGAFALGQFEAAVSAAQESVAAGAAMPFPYGEATARLMLASALQRQSRYIEAAAEYERILAVPSRYRQGRHLDLLPLVALLQRVNQPERARLLALDYLADLDERPTPERSLTLYYLSLANVSLRRWPEVFAALEQSAAADEARGELADAASKRLELADWRIKPYWFLRSPPPADVFRAAMDAFDDVERHLDGLTPAEVDNVRMSLHQSRAMAFQASGRTADALSELDRFGELADRLGSRVHQTNYHTQSGLILHDRAQRGDSDAATAAQQHLDRALTMTLATNAPDDVANAAYLAAANERVIARFAVSSQGALEHLSRAVTLLEEADHRIAQLQTRYTEPGAEASQRAGIAIHGRWKKVYDLAIELLIMDVGNVAEGFSWVEKWKGRSLAVTLGLRPLRPPDGIPRHLLAEERTAIEALGDAQTYAAIIEARDRLRNAWNELAMAPEAAEYVSIRTGQPVAFHELRALLAAEERLLL